MIGAGVGLTLGLVGALAAAAQVRRRTTGSACVSCGGALGGSANRGSRAVEPQSIRGLEDKRYSTRVAEIKYLGPSFYVQRNDAPAWFRAPVSVVRALEAKRKAFYVEQWTSILRAMGATELTWGPSFVDGPQEVKGGLSLFTVAYIVDEREQVSALEGLGVFSVAADDSGVLHSQPVTSAPQYLQQKQDAVKSLAANSNRGWTRRFPREFYAARFYVERQWTMEVLAEASRNSERPVSRRENRKTLSAPLTLRDRSSTVFSGLEMRLVLPEQAKGVIPENPDAFEYGAVEDGQPSIIMFDPAINSQVAIFNISDSGTMGTFRMGRVSVPLLAKTTKMSAPSLSLPAGSHRAGGTCIMAGVEVETGHKEELTVCNSCYATKANYGYAESMVSTHVRLEWVISMLKVSSGLFADAMEAAVIAYARYTHKGDKESPRNSQELGVWSSAAKKIVVPSAPKSKAASYANVTRFTAYSKLGLPHKDSADLFSKTPDGAVCGFFRIHDAGDFTATAALMDKYIEGWTEVVRRLPHVYFWAPTRVWAVKKMPMGKPGLTAQDQQWLASGAVAGAKIDLSGSKALIVPKIKEAAARLGAPSLKSVGGRLAARVALRMEDLLPAELAKSHISDLLEDYGHLIDTGGAYSPGEIEPVLTDGAQSKTQASFVYVPGMASRQGRALLSAASLPNFSVRPSSLYVKTPENPAFIPNIDGLSAGSGVNAKWGSIWSWLGALQLDAVPERQYASTAKSYAKKLGKDPDSYVPVFDNLKRAAYQCPVYSLLPVLDERGQPLKGSDSLPELAEAKSCAAAGCRACWLAKSTPITYGYH